MSESVAIRQTEEAFVAGWHAEEIVVDYFESEDWAALDDVDAEPELDSEPVAPHESAA